MSDEITNLDDELIPYPAVPPDPENPRIRAAVEELKALIDAHYPGTTYEVYRGEAPDMVRLLAIVDASDLDDVDEVFNDRLVAMQLDELLPIMVVLDLPPHRLREQRRQASSRRDLLAAASS